MVLFTTSFSLLMNDSSADFFRGSKGLRKGKPLSPYLFVVSMEAFQCLLKELLGEATFK